MENVKNQEVTISRRKAFGDQIVRYRKSRGLSQKDLAASVGIDCGNLCKIERGVYNVGFDTLARIAACMGLEIVLGINFYVPQRKIW